MFFYWAQPGNCRPFPECGLTWLAVKRHRWLPVQICALAVQLQEKNKTKQKAVSSLSSPLSFPLQKSRTEAPECSRHRSRTNSSNGKWKQELFAIMWPNCHFLSIEKTILTGQERKAGTPGKLVYSIPCHWGCVLTLTSLLNAKAPEKEFNLIHTW